MNAQKEPDDLSPGCKFVLIGILRLFILFASIPILIHAVPPFFRDPLHLDFISPRTLFPYERTLWLIPCGLALLMLFSFLVAPLEKHHYPNWLKISQIAVGALFFLTLLTAVVVIESNDDETRRAKTKSSFSIQL